MVILAKNIRLRERLARKRSLRSNSLGAVRTSRSNSFTAILTSHTDGAVDDGRKLVLVGQERRKTRPWVLKAMASNQAPMSVQRAPSKVSGSLSFDSSSSTVVKRH